MRQCLLECSPAWQVVWLPSQFAKLGKRVKLKDSPTVWTVTAVYDQWQEWVEVKDWKVGGL